MFWVEEKLMNDNIDISIIVLTYFHEDYISKALDSILMQKTKCKYEVLIGDDASEDNTPQIIKEYANKFPQIIKPFLRKKNIGANRNEYELLKNASGKYIAILEGDDYWLDKEKLQKQFDFLEKNEQYIGCCSKCLVVDENDIPDYTRFPHFVCNKKIFTLEDLIRYWDLPAQAGTIMYRNIFKNMNPQQYSIIYNAHKIVGDKTLMLILLSRAPMYCFNEILSCYRFVIKKNGHNWFSIHHSNQYWQYDGFMYPCRLEKWARKNLKLKKHMGNRKDYHFITFIQDFFKKPSAIRFKYICEMILNSHQPVKYTWFVIKALIEMEE